jgi:polyhydroxyalkanoate synthesis regulator phasin
MRSRLSALEDRLGSKDKGTGVSQEVVVLQAKVQTLTERIEALQKKDSPPILQRPPSYPEFSFDWSQGPQSSTRVKSDLEELKEEVDKLKRKQSTFVSESDFDASDRERGRQIQEIFSTLSELKGLLSGLREGLGIKRSR